MVNASMLCIGAFFFAHKYVENISILKEKEQRHDDI
jgi:hypothetical protein